MKQLPVGTRSRMAFKEAEFCTKNVPFFPNSKLDWLPLRFILKSVSHYLRHEVRLVFKTTAQMAQFVLFLLDDAWHSIKCDRSLSIQYFFDELFHLAPKRVASCCDYFWRSPCYSLVSRRDLRSAIISSAFVWRFHSVVDALNAEHPQFCAHFLQLAAHLSLRFLLSQVAVFTFLHGSILFDNN